MVRRYLPHRSDAGDQASPDGARPRTGREYARRIPCADQGGSRALDPGLPRRASGPRIDQRQEREMPVAMKETRNAYEVERREYYAARPGFRIAELQLSPTQTVPWHYHSNVQDTFYVVSGSIRIFAHEP